MRIQRLLLGILGTSALVLSAPGAARAQVGGDAVAGGAAGDKAVAEALFDEGKRLVDAGQFAEACAKFEESQRLDAGLGTMLYLADCYERSGRTASAWATFREAAAAAKAAGQAEREQVARARAEALEPRLHRLAVKVTDPTEGLSVERVDAKTGRREPLARAAWGVPLPVDPGSYRVEATAPGRTSWSAQVEVPATPGSSTSVVPTLSLVAAPALAPTPAPTPPQRDAADEDRGDGQRIVGVSLMAAGGVGLAIGGIFTALALSADDEAAFLCGDDGPTCEDPEGVTASEDAVAKGNVATVGFIAGSVLAASGLIVFLAAPSDAPASGGGVVVSTAAPDADVGLSLGGSF